MGFPPDTLPSTSLPLEGINFLEKKKKSLPVSSVLLAHPVAGLELVGCSSVPPDLGDEDGGEGAREGGGEQKPSCCPEILPFLPPPATL